MTGEQLDLLSINTIRTLSIDAVQAGQVRPSRHADSGHGPAGVYNLEPRPAIRSARPDLAKPRPVRPVQWPCVDAVVVGSCILTQTHTVNAEYERLGHPSVTLDDLRRFRQLESKAPGHPEYRWVSGIECTTGPLGQGVATSVGMAIGQKWLAARYNRPNFDIFDYDIYAICGDGCLMKGGGSEAASIAGHLGLDNSLDLDNNHITIEGNTQHHLHGGLACRFHGLWVECLARWRCQRHGPHRTRPDLFRTTTAGRRSSSSTVTSATARPTNRTPPRHTANRSAKMRFA